MLASTVDNTCVLKIIAVNDVYSNNNWPFLKTCREEEESTANKCIAVLPGDFVSPSLLSSIDKGASMIRCMNSAGIDYVCFGNHEADISFHELQKRVKESSFQWINSNMPEIDIPTDKAPPYVIIDAVSKSGLNKRRVALLGLVTDDQRVYKGNPFGGCKIKSFIETACYYYDQLTNDIDKVYGRIDAVIPLTHGRIEVDRELAAKRPFCCIIGGHEHTVFDEMIQPYGNHVVKTGMDGTNIGICTIRWDDIDSTSHSVTITIKKEVAKLYKADPVVQEVVHGNNMVLYDLKKSILCYLTQKTVSSSFNCDDDDDDDEADKAAGATASSLDGIVVFPLSSKQVRVAPASMATFLCSVVRDEMKTDCCLLNGGGIRGDSCYTEGSPFSFADLMKELPFQDPMTVINLPGSVIADTICYSRAQSLLTIPIQMGYYMQTDSFIEWNAASNTVLRIANKPFDKDQVYSVAISSKLLEMKELEPLLDYIKSQPVDDPNVHKEQDSGISIIELIVSHFARTILFQFLKTYDDFDQMDSNHDFLIDKKEFHDFMKEKQKQKQQMMMNQKKRKLESSSSDDHIDTKDDDDDAYVDVVTDIMIDNLFNILDVNGDGSITMEEYHNFLVCQRDN